MKKLTPEQITRVIRFRLAYQNDLPDICEQSNEEIMEYLNRHKDFDRNINRSINERLARK